MATANQYKHMAQRHIIETYGPQPNNRNIWPHNSRATVFCHAWPILLSALVAALISLLLMGGSLSLDLRAVYVCMTACMDVCRLTQHICKSACIHVGPCLQTRIYYTHTTIYYMYNVYAALHYIRPTLRKPYSNRLHSGVYRK